MSQQITTQVDTVSQVDLELTLAKILHPERKFALMAGEVVYLENNTPYVMPRYTRDHRAALDLLIEHDLDWNTQVQLIWLAVRGDYLGYYAYLNTSHPDRADRGVFYFKDKASAVRWAFTQMTIDKLSEK